MGGGLFVPKGYRPKEKEASSPTVRNPIHPASSSVVSSFVLDFATQRGKGGGISPKSEEEEEARPDCQLRWEGGRPNLRKRWLVACLIALEESEAGHAN